MRTILIKLFGLTIGQLSAWAGWHPDVRENRKREKKATISYSWSEDRKTSPSINGLAEILTARDKTIPLKRVSFWHYFRNDPIIQQELLKQFRIHYSELLAEALKSSDMQNPKVIPWKAKFHAIIWLIVPPKTDEKNAD